MLLKPDIPYQLPHKDDKNLTNELNETMMNSGRSSDLVKFIISFMVAAEAMNITQYNVHQYSFLITSRQGFNNEFAK